jgi:peroxiredoxin/predicted 2-oxoglutarate/Fe(II)-dependent dioxygenase YbiX
MTQQPEAPAASQPAPQAARYRRVEAGDPAPWFRQRSTSNPNYNFDTVGGRYVVLCFFASAGDAAGQDALKILEEHRGLFNDADVAFFGVSLDPGDETRVKEQLPGIRFIWDFDASVSRLYGVAPVEADSQKIAVRRVWFVIDPMLRVRAVIPFRPDGADRLEVVERLKSLPPRERFVGFPIQAPILVLPNVFEPEFCQQLISLYETHGGAESGFMREVDGKTVMTHDFGHKRRSDYVITDEKIVEATRMRIRRRIVPEIQKAHQAVMTRMERYIVACYDSTNGGHFRPHRDNTTKGTAHRRFAVSINLNAEFEGGEVSFPEYGPQSFKPPPGGAVVFSCSILHAVSPMTAGRRFAFLPFLYDEEAAKVREENNKFLGDGVGAYRTNV